MSKGYHIAFHFDAIAPEGAICFVYAKKLSAAVKHRFTTSLMIVARTSLRFRSNSFVASDNVRCIANVPHSRYNSFMLSEVASIY